MFFAILFMLRQVNWMTVLNIEETGNKVDEKLGDLYWQFYKESEKEINNEEIKEVLDSILHKICTSNNIDEKKIKLHLVENSEVNAFALPDGHIVVYSGLILASDNETEFAGVLCHELAHINLDHVMKKLVKEIGLSTLLSMTAGNSNGELIQETAKILSSTAYDRKLEREADLEAVKYLVNSNMNPESFALFLFRLRDHKFANASYNLGWISTHPSIEVRVDYIMQQSEESETEYVTVLYKQTWKDIQELISNKL